jgi:hypothetical protein
MASLYGLPPTCSNGPRWINMPITSEELTWCQLNFINLKSWVCTSINYIERLVVTYKRLVRLLQQLTEWHKMFRIWRELNRHVEWLYIRICCQCQFYTMPNIPKLPRPPNLHRTPLQAMYMYFLVGIKRQIIGHYHGMKLLRYFIPRQFRMHLKHHITP